MTHGFVVDVDGRKISKSNTYNKPMDAGHFVDRYGADLVRLWVSSVEYTDDVPFSEEMFTRLGDTYRRIRNTLRILLGNLSDFPLAGIADPVSAQFTLVDRVGAQQVAGSDRAPAGRRMKRTISAGVSDTLESILHGGSQRALRGYHQRPHVLRRARRTAPPWYPDRDATDFRRALPAARPDPCFHRGGSVGLSQQRRLRPPAIVSRAAGQTPDFVVRQEVEELLKLRGLIGQEIGGTPGN